MAAALVFAQVGVLSWWCCLIPSVSDSGASEIEVGLGRGHKKEHLRMKYTSMRLVTVVVFGLYTYNIQHP